MTILTKILIGSRLHGLHNEKSDYDWRTIHIDPKAVLSPFRAVHNNTPEQEDWELRDFCKYLIKGHPRVIEVLLSNIIEIDSESVAIMRRNWQKFIDSEAYVATSLRYAEQQYKRFETTNDHRTPKFLTASILTLWRCRHFTQTGQFPLQINNATMHSSLLNAKQGNIDKDFLGNAYNMLHDHLLEISLPDSFNHKPDINFIEDFLYDTYLHYS